jgi:glucose-6-phosphate isomerase
MRDKTVSPDVFSNPAYLYAAIHFLASVKGANMSVLMPYSNALFDLSDWYCRSGPKAAARKHRLKERPYSQDRLRLRRSVQQPALTVPAVYGGPFDKVVNIIDVKKYRKEITIPDVSAIRRNGLSLRQDRKQTDSVRGERHMGSPHRKPAYDRSYHLDAITEKP